MQTIRYHYMDNLRAGAMLLGVFFHAMLAYVPNMQTLWLAANPENSEVFSVIAWYTHLFRMPLFFLIAGFFATYLVRKRGLKSFLKNRSLRLALPFVIFWPLILVSIIGPMLWALSNIENPSPMLALIQTFQSMENPPQTPLSTTHLWFIYNLFMFCLVYALLERFAAPIFAFLERVLTVRVLVFLVPILIIPAMASQVEPHPAPEQFTPRLWSFGYYGLFFLVGTIVFRRQSLIDELRPYLPLMLIASTIMYVVYYRLLPQSFTFEEAMAMVGGPPLTLQQVGISALEAFMSVHLTLICLVLGKQLLDRASKPVRFVADSSYWVYIMHLPVLFFIQYLLLDTNWNLWIEFLVSSFATLGIGMLTYALLVRPTPIGWMLNGRRKHKQGEPVPA